MSSSAPVPEERRSRPPRPSRSLGAGWWLALAAVAAGVVALGSVVRLPLVPAWFGSHDKLTHVLAYAVLAALLMRAVSGRRERVAVALLLVAFGIGAECAQTLVPGRRFELLDMLANAAGVLLAWRMSPGPALGGRRPAQRAALASRSPSDSRSSRISCRRESSSNARTRAFTS